MTESRLRNQDVLVTGGTSGLGLELVRLLLRQGCRVVATGRQQVNVVDIKERFAFYKVDFGNLELVSSMAREIFMNHSIGTIVNNAGILSPPSYTETMNGLEYTFQVNFLAHLLVNEIFLNSVNDDRHIIIAAVSSPVYRIASLEAVIATGPETYNPIRSYSSSKLFQAMMNEFLLEKHKGLNMACFSFNPGTFSSGIHRMQKKWFRIMYRIAAPFMWHPGRAASSLADLLTIDKVESGVIYDIQKQKHTLPEMDYSDKSALIKKCYSLIDSYLI